MKKLSAFPITPADADGRVDVGALRRLIAPLISARVDSIGLLGSTGSYPYLTRTERRRALEAAIDEATGRVSVLVGVGALRTDEAVRLAQDAHDIGASAGLLAPLSYTPLNDDEVFEHFATVAHDSRLPLCIYDNPGTTHFRFSPALVGRLSRVPGIVAIKSPGADAETTAAELHDLRSQVPNGFSLGYSGDWHAVEALLAGGDVWYSVVAGLFPDLAMTIVEAVRAGDAVSARELNAGLKPLWTLFQEFSSLRVIFTMVDTLGLCRPELPRPLLPLTGAAKAKVVETLERLPLPRRLGNKSYTGQS